MKTVAADTHAIGHVERKCEASNCHRFALASCVMKVDGLDIDVGVEDVLVEEDCTTCVMGNVEALRFCFGRDI